MKKLLCIILSIVTLFTINTTTFAATDNRYKNLSEITTEELSNYALNFAKEVDESLALSTGKMIPIYDSNDRLVGYSIEYYIDNTPYGYINLNFTYEDPVVEFVIQKNARSLYTYIEDDVQATNSACKVEEKLYITSPDEYSVVFKDINQQKFYFNANDGKITANEYNAKKNAVISSIDTYSSTNNTKYDSHSDLFNSSYEAGSIIVTEPKYTSKYSSDKSMLSQQDIMLSTYKYACGVVALTEIANQEGILKNSDIADTFNALWNATSTKVETVETFYNISVSCGSTYDYKLAKGMKSYCNDMGKTNTTTTTNSNPTFSFFTDAISNNYSATLSYRIYTADGAKSGHTVNVFGYCTATKSGTSSNYLIVADGWYNDAPKYMNYSSIDFANTYGVKYIIQ